MENQTTPCKALVLAGGGARGSYQVGVWKALMELDWHPQIITCLLYTSPSPRDRG